DVVPKEKLSYIMGNPPFVGFTFMTAEQKNDMQILFPKVKNLDLVCGWYKKTSDLIQNTKIECGFVSTNSITEGETVSTLWKFINIHINYAYTTFVWNSETKLKANVHCVIIGFAAFERNTKILYQDGFNKQVKNINAYLCDSPNILVTSRNKPLCKVSPMVYGNKPADGGNLIIEDDDYAEFITKEPQAEKFIKPLLGASEYLHNKKRWCLWLDGVSPTELKKCPMVYERIARCKESREKSVATAIRKFAETPTLFAQRTQPVGKPFIIIPRVSSQRRKYIPMGFMDGNTIVTDLVQIVPEASMYEFGILTSNIHMAWMRAVCSRMKSDYRYSKDIVYNNFPWCNPTPEQKKKIESTAQAILNARAKYPDCSLADLYDELTMPPELRKAHQANDFAVMSAYGFDKKITESECVAELMKMYQKLT
ncbi:MAG: class I SAM-dependent DNA methyltransferase, partial [Ruminococcus flavefaciens]|nr:class I SAM-dependent DNA methyltransferase [Ruminococcus flavefaciens]